MPASRRRAPPPHAALVAVVGAVFAAACPVPSGHPNGRVDPAALPSDPLECLRLAEQWSRPGTSLEKKLDALIALDRAAELQSDPFVTAILRTRTLFRLAEDHEAEPGWSDWVEAGMAAAAAAVAISPDRVEGHYYLAAMLGRKAERATVGALDLVPRIRDAAERAVAIDRTYDNCGPLLALGMLYIAAPPWPQSIGDPETGIDYLREAVACSDYPINLIILAEALLDQAEWEEARALLREALGRPPTGDWGIAGNRWRPIARELLDRAENPGRQR